MTVQYLLDKYFEKENVNTKKKIQANSCGVEKKM